MRDCGVGVFAASPWRSRVLDSSQDRSQVCGPQRLSSLSIPTNDLHTFVSDLAWTPESVPAWFGLMAPSRLAGECVRVDSGRRAGLDEPEAYPHDVRGRRQLCSG